MATIFSESFETDGGGTRYTTSVPEFSDSFSDFFTRTDGANISSSYNVIGSDGNFFFTAQDIDGEGAEPEQTLLFSGIDITGFTDLEFSALFAEDDDGSNEDWDAPNFVLVEYQIDGNGFQSVLAIENDGSTFNSAPFIDTDFDGNGDGAEITDTFATFSRSIAGTGNSLDLRFTINLNDGDEDIAIDNIQIFGTAGNGGGSQSANLFISEYVEGSSNNKAIELFNPTSSAIDLANFTLGRVSNGGTDVEAAIALSGTLAPGATYVIANPSATSAILDVADATSGNINHNGNDAYLLLEGGSSLAAGGTVVDFFGTGDLSTPVIEDPGSQWSDGTTNTQNQTLIRNPDVSQGNPNGFDPISTLSDEWIEFAVETFSDLGQHTFNGDIGGGTTLAIAPTDADKAEGDTGTTPFTFTVTRSGDTSGVTTVDFSTTDGTAIAGADYTDNSGILTFEVGETIQTITVDVIGDTDTESDETFSVDLFNPSGSATITDGTATGTIVNDDVATTPIYEIQGNGNDFTDEFYKSPFEGQQVVTEGIVTALVPLGNSNGNDVGFYIQDAMGDNNDNTSDGIFVVGAIGNLAVGHEVQVSGTVVEEFEQTEIDNVTRVTVLSTGNSIDPVVLGIDRIAPTEIVDDAGSTDYDVTRDGRDFYESLEGMLVTLSDGVAVSLTNRFDEFYAISSNGNPTGVNARGGITISEDTSANNPIGADLNPERIQIDSDLLTDSAPTVDVGDRIGDITGVINYGFNDYAISPIAPVSGVQPTSLTPETTNLVGTDDQLTIATFNVLNLDPGDPASKFNALGAQITDNLGAPDIIGLQEIQDNNGPTNNGVTAADQTLQELVDAIAAAGGPTYQFIDNTFITNNASGGQPGANIRTTFLYREDRVDLVPGSVRPVGDQAPGSPFNGARLPLVADFTFGGETVTVINNHFSSKGGSDPLFGEDQPPSNGSLDEREAQATAVNNFVSSELASDPDANIVALGDFNEFQFFTPLEILEQNLTNLTETLPETERYTFNFEGNAQALDHVLVTDDLASTAEYDTVHINSEFADAPSDHDPAVARFTIVPANTAPVAVDDTATTDEDEAVAIDVLANDTDDNGDELSVASFDDSATFGEVELNADGTFDYDPHGVFTFLAAGETATDTFGYTVSDGNDGTDTAEVTITVEGPSDVFNSGTPFSFSQGTNGGANRFGFDGDAFFISGQGVGGRPTFQDFDDFLVKAADVFDGDVENSGKINDQRLADGDGPNGLRVNANDEVIISGNGIGGSYKIQFDDSNEANNFLDFVKDMFEAIDENDAIATDPEDFRFDATVDPLTGATARLFFDGVKDQYGFTTDGVAEQVRFNELEIFVEQVANLLGGEQLRDGRFNEARIADGRIPNRIRVNGDDVTISGRSVGGRFQFGFADAATATSYATAMTDLFSNIAEVGAIANGDLG